MPANRQEPDATPHIVNGAVASEHVPQTKFILGTAGHIDHGKTALVRALTGVDTDRLPQERQRGMTIDIGFARLELDGFELGIVDVPGHERFVRNMLAGATANDLAMLIIAADDSVMPQTREHLAILKLLDVQHGVIVITKCDLVDEELLEMVEQEARKLVEGTFLADAPLVRTAATKGMGIEALRSTLSDVCRRIAAPVEGSLLRLAVDRAFVMQGQGTVVTGSVASGSLSVSDEVQWLPARKTLRVRSLESHGRPVERVRRGQRAAIGLVGVHHKEILRGHELATPGYLKPTRLLTTDVTVLDNSPRPLKHRAKVRLHLGSGQTVAIVSLLHDQALYPGRSAVAQLFTAEPVAAVCGQPFILRSLSPVATLGGGRVLQPLARRVPKRRARQFEFVEGLGSQGPALRADAAIYACGTAPWSDLDLCRDAKLQPHQVPGLLEDLTASGVLIELPIAPNRTARLHRRVVAMWEQRTLDAIAAYHGEKPLHTAMPRRVLVERLHLADEEGLLQCLLQRLDADAKVALRHDAVSLAGFQPKLSAQQRQLYETAIAAYQAGGFQPPAPDQIAQKAGSAVAAVRQMIDLAVDQGELKHLGGGLYLAAAVESDLRQRVQQRLAGGRTMTVSQIRDVLGTSRKFAVPICEYLDRIGLTRRTGDLRTLAGEKPQIHTDAHG